jgi:hypothetical protein
MKAKVIIDTENYNGMPCKCGYFYDEGTYEHKGRKDDYTTYNCENCHDSFIVMPNECPVDEITHLYLKELITGEKC